jgi:hypothetical protein
MMALDGKRLMLHETAEHFARHRALAEAKPIAQEVEGAFVQ